LYIHTIRSKCACIYVCICIRMYMYVLIYMDVCCMHSARTGYIYECVCTGYIYECIPHAHAHACIHARIHSYLGRLGSALSSERPPVLVLLRWVFRLFITERKGNIHWNVPSRVEASKAALKQLPACHATRGKTEEPYDPQRTTT
jgi:hypothetical protein